MEKAKIKKILNLLKIAVHPSGIRMLVRKSGKFVQIIASGEFREAFRKAVLFLRTLGRNVEDSRAWTPARRYFGTVNIPENSYESFYEKEEDFSSRTTDIKALAFYLPQFHSFPENDRWWGKGFTEWVNTRKAQPRYPSHYQPREPHEDIGYYDLSDWHTLLKQAELVRRHGLYGLCIYHYWFSGKQLMEKPLELLMQHPEIDLKFCLCWANENWTRAWDGLEKHVLIAQKHQNDDLEYIIDLKKYLQDSRYIRVNGEPLILVYRPGILPDAAKTFRRWREWAESNGIGKIRILVVRGCANTPESMFVEGADGEVEFPPAYTAMPTVLKSSPDGMQILYYASYVNEIISGRGCTESYSHPVYRGAMLGWDCTPRRKAFHAWYGFSPQWYYRWLRYNIEYTRRHHDPEDRFIFINAWNEWAEGTYLEPDRLFGYTNLNTTSRALFDLPFSEPPSPEQKMQIVGNSPFFDLAWYSGTYQDIAAVGMNPLFHFVQTGWKEGRSPSEYFPNALYLFFNPDVSRADCCSLMDFIAKKHTPGYLRELTERFDAIQSEVRKKLKIELMVPPAAEPSGSAKSVAVHLHCFYIDMVPEICAWLAKIPFPFDLLVSLPGGGRKTKMQLAETFKKSLPRMNLCDIRICPNRGRDIAPLICTFGRQILKYDYFCHIHTKKSLHSPTHAVWAEFICRHLFQSEDWVRRILGLLDAGAAVVYPPDFLMMKEEPSGWGSDREQAQELLKRFHKDVDLARDFPVIEFPQGSMIWGSVSAFRQMFSLKLKFEDFPKEPLRTDGSIAHALERLFFIWCMDHPGRICQVFLPGEEALMGRKRYWFKPLEQRKEKSDPAQGQYNPAAAD